MRNILVPLFLVLLVTVVSSPANWALMQLQPGVAKKDDQQILSNSPPTTVLAQARLLIEINNRLVHGSISPDQSVNLRRAVDGVGAAEDRYLATSNSIPPAVFRQEVSTLAGIDAELDRYVQSASVQGFKGSAVLQDQVRAEVDQCLAHKEILANQARDFNTKVNSICTEEAWYLSIDTGTIPEKVMQKDVKELKDLDGQLKSTLAQGKTATAL